MITIKLTKKEAEDIFNAITWLEFDAECWDDVTKKQQGGKRFFNSLSMSICDNLIIMTPSELK